MAAQVLTKQGADLAQVRQTVIQMLSGYQRGDDEGRESVGAGVGARAVPSDPTLPFSSSSAAT